MPSCYLELYNDFGICWRFVCEHAAPADCIFSCIFAAKTCCGALQRSRVDIAHTDAASGSRDAGDQECVGGAAARGARRRARTVCASLRSPALVVVIARQRRRSCSFVVIDRLALLWRLTGEVITSDCNVDICLMTNKPGRRRAVGCVSTLCDAR